MKLSNSEGYGLWLHWQAISRQEPTDAALPAYLYRADGLWHWLVLLRHWVPTRQAPAHQAKNPNELPATLDWQEAGGHDLVFSHTDSVYWVRLHLTNSSEKRGFWYLKLNYPLLDDVTFWQDGTSTSSTLITGDQHSFLSRGIDYRYFLLPVTLGSGEKQEITLRIRSSGALMASMGIFLFAMGGFANQYFWPDSIGFANTSIPLLIARCALAMTLFGRSLMPVRSWS